MKKRGKKSFISVILALVLFAGTFNVSAITVNAEGGKDAAQYAPSLEGIYTIQSAIDGSYLANVNNDIALQKDFVATNCVWKLEEHHPDYGNDVNGHFTYFIRVPDKDLRFDIDNAFVVENNKVKLCYFTGYDVQHWNFEGNSDGTITIVSSSNSSYVLALKDGKTVIQKRNGSNGQKWIIKSYTNYFYKTLYSDDGVIMLELPLDINKLISDEELIKLANKWSMAYKEMINFHSGKQPYCRLIFDCYSSDSNAPYGYVYGYGNNHVYFNSDCIKDCVELVQIRENDWNFAALHEMGHLFDSREAWNFETEVLTDFRLVYVLEKVNGGANPALDMNIYDYKTMKHKYLVMDGAHYHKGYSIFYTDYMLLQIKDAVGWEPFMKAFAYIDSVQNEASINASQINKFDNFINTVSYYAGTDVRQFVDPTDYAKLREYLKGFN